MLVSNVALVVQTDRIKPGQAAAVAAALQRQASREFKRYWDIDANVSYFPELGDVPPGYWQIIVRDDVPHHKAGYHQNEANGQPYALVQYSSSWSLTASHECLEMLADPYGRRTIPGDSLHPEQGRVEYLVEVCDPCQAAKFAYHVNGILVSDFYTPAYFDPAASAGIAYSFNGSITAPRQVLQTGYISWIDPATQHLWQMFLHTDEPEFKDRGVFSGGTGSLRSFSDRASADQHPLKDATASPDAEAMLESTLELMPEPFPAFTEHAQNARTATAAHLQEQIHKLIGK